MRLNETRTVTLEIASYFSGSAGMRPGGEIAFAPDTLLSEPTCEAILEGQSVKLRLDQSRRSKNHPFIYATII